MQTHLVDVRLVSSERNTAEVEGLGGVVEQVLKVLLPRSRRKRRQALNDGVVKLEARGLLLACGADHAPLEDPLETRLERGEVFGGNLARVVEDALLKERGQSSPEREEGGKADLERSKPRILHRLQQGLKPLVELLPRAPPRRALLSSIDMLRLLRALVAEVDDLLQLAKGDLVRERFVLLSFSPSKAVKRELEQQRLA